MIWLYIAVTALGVLLHVAAHNGSQKYEMSTSPYSHEIRQSFWMIPVNITAFLLWGVGFGLTIYETGRIYGGWN